MKKRKIIVGVLLGSLLIGCFFGSRSIMASRQTTSELIKVKEQESKKIKDVDDSADLSSEELNKVMYDTLEKYRNGTLSSKLEFENTSDRGKLAVEEALLFLTRVFPFSEYDKMPYEVTEVDEDHYLVTMGDWNISVAWVNGGMIPYEFFRKVEPTDEELKMMKSFYPYSEVIEKDGLYIWDIK